MKRTLTPLLSPLLLLLASCSGSAAEDSVADPGRPFVTSAQGQFNEPWALAFLPGTPYALVSERGGRLMLWEEGKPARRVAGTPAVAYGGQGGLGDIRTAPDFAASGMVYLTWAEPGPNGTRGAALGRARLVLEGAPRLDGLKVIWRQAPKVTGQGHYAHRLAFSADGQYLFVASGDRQKMAPAQDPGSDLGKVLRLRLDGTPAPAAEATGGGRYWSYGHRNILGLKFDPAGRLWAAEHGPAGGDELNLIEPGRNYGWPLVSGGDHYDGRPIPRHATRPDLAAPAISWNPVIGPGNFIFYTGSRFPAWRGHALIAALVSGGLVEVAIEDDRAREVARYPFGRRLRDVVEREDGTIWVLEDGFGARLLRLTPAR